jgi:hypothetical protein
VALGFNKARADSRGLSALQFYVNKGWPLLPAIHCVLNVPSSTSWRRDALPETRRLGRDDVPKLCARDVESLKTEVNQHPTALGTRLVAVAPSPHLISFFQDRAEYMSLKLNGKPLEDKGAICEQADMWVFWYHDFRKKVLYIQRTKVAQGSDEMVSKALASILVDALAEAQAWGLKHVVLWSPGPDVHRATQYLNNEMGIEIYTGSRDSSLPCMRWEGGDRSKPVEILAHEYFAYS